MHMRRPNVTYALLIKQIIKACAVSVIAPIKRIQQFIKPFGDKKGKCIWQKREHATYNGMIKNADLKTDNY